MTQQPTIGMVQLSAVARKARKTEADVFTQAVDHFVDLWIWRDVLTCNDEEWTGWFRIPRPKAATLIGEEAAQVGSVQTPDGWQLSFLLPAQDDRQAQALTVSKTDLHLKSADVSKLIPASKRDPRCERTERYIAKALLDLLTDKRGRRYFHSTEELIDAMLRMLPTMERTIRGRFASAEKLLSGQPQTDQGAEWNLFLIGTMKRLLMTEAKIGAQTDVNDIAKEISKIPLHPFWPDPPVSETKIRSSLRMLMKLFRFQRSAMFAE